MSQKAKLTKTRGGSGSRNSLSQPARLTRSDDDPAESENATQSLQAGSGIAKRVYEAMDAQLWEKLVSEVVRYLLCAEGRKIPVRRKELTDKVLGEHSRAFPIVLEQANEKLSRVFGLEAREITKGKVKSVILVNKLPSEAMELGLIKWYTQ